MVIFTTFGSINPSKLRWDDTLYLVPCLDDGTDDAYDRPRFVSADTKGCEIQGCDLPTVVEGLGFLGCVRSAYVCMHSFGQFFCRVIPLQLFNDINNAGVTYHKEGINER